MTSREPQARLAAAYQLMASYLIWDLHDLLRDGKLADPDARGRVRQFNELLEHALAASKPAYPAGRPEPAAQGAARARQTSRIVSRGRDEELMNLILAARGDKDRAGASNWTQQAHEVLSAIESQGWKNPDEDERQFLEEQVDPFLRRLQRIDELEAYRPGKRPGLTRR